MSRSAGKESTSKNPSGTSLASLLKSSTVLQSGPQSLETVDRRPETRTDDFSLVLFLNDSQRPVCVGFPLEGLDAGADIAASATQAEIAGNSLTLLSPEKKLKLDNVHPAITTALEQGLALVVFDKIRGVERLVPVVHK